MIHRTSRFGSLALLAIGAVSAASATAQTVLTTPAPTETANPAALLEEPVLALPTKPPATAPRVVDDQSPRTELSRSAPAKSLGSAPQAVVDTRNINERKLALPSARPGQPPADAPTAPLAAARTAAAGTPSLLDRPPPPFQPDAKSERTMTLPTRPLTVAGK